MQSRYDRQVSGNDFLHDGLIGVPDIVGAQHQNDDLRLYDGVIEFSKTAIVRRQQT